MQLSIYIVDITPCHSLVTYCQLVLWWVATKLCSIPAPCQTLLATYSTQRYAAQPIYICARFSSDVASCKQEKIRFKGSGKGKYVCLQAEQRRQTETAYLLWLCFVYGIWSASISKRYIFLLLAKANF